MLRRRTLAVAVAGMVALTLAVSGCSASDGGPSGDGRPVLEPIAAEPTSTVDATSSAGATETADVAPQIPMPKKQSQEQLGVVVIDPGHQGKGDYSTEPIGPGAKERKPRVTTGTTGVSSGKPESVVVLEIAERLRDELNSRGVEVILVRDSQDINISNSERAAIANEANADLFIRLHCDGSEDRSRQGLSTLVPGKNQWTAPIVTESGRAGGIVHRSVVAATGAKDLGVVQRTDLSGFNWAKVPTVLVEMGFMSNAEEDRKLASSEYQVKLAKGMADGTVEYLRVK